MPPELPAPVSAPEVLAPAPAPPAASSPASQNAPSESQRVRIWDPDSVLLPK
jgi:hypothetical protein